MNPENIFALTRISDRSDLARLERQLSKRRSFLKIREWEIRDLCSFVSTLSEYCEKAYELEFYYSFTMPKLGKEFDLLRVNDEYIVNIELKSRTVTEEAIKKQLLVNRYYLSTVGRTAYFYTYIGESGKLLRLSNSGKLVDATWAELATVLHRQTDCYRGDIEDLFKEDKYLISPLTDPGRFLRGEYFLTNQQNDIKRQILKKINTFKTGKQGDPCIQGFTGLPGTGKTILLYDIAMQLSKYDKVCIFHMGSHEKELEQLDERLKRIDFRYLSEDPLPDGSASYSALLVDEGHRMKEDDAKHIFSLSKRLNAPVVFSYDSEEPVAASERQDSGYVFVRELPGYTEYRLTNRIRLNTELSSFIKCVMNAATGRRRDYPSVLLSFGNGDEAENLLANYIDEGYVYIFDNALPQPCGGLVFKDSPSALDALEKIEVDEATCKEFDRIVMLIDESFFYDGTGALKSRVPDRRVRNLFHGLSRAKQSISVVVKDNPDVFSVLLHILQGPPVEGNGKKGQKGL